MSMKSSAGQRLLRAACHVPAVLLVPGLLAALLPRGEQLLAVASALFALGGLFAAIGLRATLRRYAHPRSILLSSSVLHAGVLILLLRASEFASRHLAPDATAAALVMGLALVGGLTAPILPGASRHARLNRLTGVIAAVLAVVWLLAASSGGMLIASAVICAAVVPLTAMKLPETAFRQPFAEPEDGEARPDPRESG
ncbi:hypothetical protein [Nesterenkonia sp. NBAIMH1]|uniref:hypothetical protein n=1 Tax=Nesterenkonia sp. NBAIMH1 TaxID=2600320 RepID=UPI00143DF1BB|nr:hypothetical protein [Nesterenkonia sp. NBAIMH1]